MNTTERWTDAATALTLLGLAAAWLLVVPALQATYVAGKLTTTTVLAAITVGVVAGVAALRRDLLRAHRLWLAVLGVVLVVMVIATVASDLPRYSLYGGRNRNIGLLNYLAAAGLGLGALVAFGEQRRARLLLWGLAGMGVVLGFAAIGDGFLGESGRDSLTIARTTMGNPNFSAAALGIATAAAAGLAALPGATVGRAIAGAAALVALLGSVATGSVQGVAAAMVGITVVGMGVLWATGGRARRQGLPAAAVVAVLAGVVVLVGIGGSGPLSGLATDGNVELRSFYWTAATEMGGDPPATGVGLSRYNAYFRSVQTDVANARLGLNTTSDDAHSVPLMMLAVGGVPLGLAWMALILTTGIIGVRGLIAGRNPLLPALLGAWAAYLVQSAVSIDVLPLAVVHLVLAGAIVAAAAPPASPTAADRKAIRARAGTAKIAAGATGAVAVLIAGVLVAPLVTAESAYRASAIALAVGQQSVAGTEAERAAQAAPWDADYAMAAAELYGRTGDVAEVERWAAFALDNDPRDFPAIMTLARVQVADGRLDDAIENYDRAVQLAPTADGTYLERGLALLDDGQTEQGEADLATAFDLAGDPDGDTAVALAQLVVNRGYVDLATSFVDGDLLQLEGDGGSGLSAGGE